MPRFKITPQVKDDLKSIGRYMLETWGRKQRDKYLKNLDQRFSWLTQNPQAEIHRPDIQEDFYCFPQGTHLVFYTLYDDGINIIGIPHKAMDILKFFKPKS